MARNKKGNTFVYSIKTTKKNVVTIVRERIYSANAALMTLARFLPESISRGWLSNHRVILRTEILHPMMRWCSPRKVRKSRVNLRRQ